MLNCLGAIEVKRKLVRFDIKRALNFVLKFKRKQINTKAVTLALGVTSNTCAYYTIDTCQTVGKTTVDTLRGHG